MAANIKMIFWLVSMAINLYYSHSILVPPPSPVVTQIEMSMKGADENRSVSSSDNLRHRRLSSLPEDQFTSLLQEASYQKAPLTPLSDIRQYKIFHILIVLSSLFLYVILTNWDSCSALYLSIAKEVQSESSVVMKSLVTSKFASLAKHPAIQTHFDNLEMSDIQGSPNFIRLQQKGHFLGPVEAGLTFWIEFACGLGSTTALDFS
eukprot:GHVP01033984.1.p1 GENE.GHVP01033984.1~~GHVP01033984.1.p1  ORF type:complete len:206 (+),score=30.77 GHVP01033984.1:1023-1640(+)